MKSIYLLLLFLFMISCKQQPKSLYRFDPGKLTESKILLSEIADDITYIPLDNTFPIGMIYNYRFSNNLIYLSAKDIGVMKFGRDGRLIGKIGSIGRGPGEYNYCFAFTVDDSTGKLLVSDESIFKVYSSSGNFLRDISFNKYPGNIDLLECYNSNLFTFYSLQFDNPVNDWVIIDTIGNEISKKVITSPKISSGWGSSGGTYKFRDNMYYWNQFNDTVFSISPDFSFKPSFIFNAGKYQFPRVDFKSFEDLPKYMMLQQVFETNHYIIIKYGLNKKINLALIDKSDWTSRLTFIEEKNNMSSVSYSGGIYNDIDGGTNFQPGGATFRPESYLVENGREYMIGTVNSYQILAWVNTNEFKIFKPKYPQKKDALVTLAASLKETDNPVLMLVRLKKK
jgi:hypothetical protein